MERNIYKIGKELFITNSEEIKEGDYCIIVDAKSALYGQFEKHKGKHLRNDQWEKIILTTDGDLIKDGVQAIPDEFLEWFVKNPSCEEIEIFETYNQEKNACGNQCKWGCHSFFECEYVDENDISKSYKIIIPSEESKQSTKNRILSETSEESKQKARDYGNFLAKQETLEEPTEHCCDCYRLLEDCTCIEDTIDMKQETTLEEAAKRTYQKGLQDDIDLSFYDGVRLGSKWQQERSYSEEEVYQLLYDLSGQVLNNKVSNPKLLEEWFEKFSKLKNG